MKNLIKQIFNSLLEKYRYQNLCTAWKNRHKKVKNIIGGFSFPCDTEEYKKKWKILNNKFNCDTLYTCFTISGKYEINYIPEELFEGVIEKKLNANAPNFLQHKSFYNRIFPAHPFIADSFHKIGGIYFSAVHKQICKNELEALTEELQFPLVVKKSVDTAGGRDVHFVQNKSELLKAINLFSDLVVQPVMKPHPYFRKFHDFGLNTIRACLYRSVKTGEVHLLNTTLRLGRDGHLDNETQGGLVCNIQENGKLNNYVVDKYGAKLYEHPNSKIRFADYPPLPAFEELEQVSIDIVKSIPYAHLVSLDLAMNDEGKWKLIEINLEFQTIRFAQYAGHPFLGQFTDEVLEYCS